MALLFYNLLLYLLSPVILAYLLFHIFISQKFHHSWRQRLTIAMPTSPTKPVIHLHVASVGEAISLVPVVAALRTRLPDYALLITSLSETGYRAVCERLSPDVATYLPLDFGPLISRFFSRYEPRLLVLMETELWPNLTATATHRGIPIIVGNGRISPGTIRRYHLFSALYRPLAKRIELFIAQSAADGRRAIEIGVPEARVVVAGDIKFDQIAANPSSPRLQTLRQSFEAPGSRVFVAGSTHPGEHEGLVDFFKGLVQDIPETYMILAPRHPEALPTLRSHIESCGLSYVLRSQQQDGAAAWDREHKILLVDTMGELAYLYQFGSLAFIGGSLVPVGGHSPLEPAVLGIPVLFGPQAFNFAEANELLLSAGGAIAVQSPRELYEQTTELLADPERCRSMGQLARDAVLAHSGASATIAEHIAEQLTRSPVATRDETPS